MFFWKKKRKKKPKQNSKYDFTKRSALSSIRNTETKHSPKTKKRLAELQEFEWASSSKLDSIVLSRYFFFLFFLFLFGMTKRRKVEWTQLLGLRSTSLSCNYFRKQTAQKTLFSRSRKRQGFDLQFIHFRRETERGKVSEEEKRSLVNWHFWGLCKHSARIVEAKLKRDLENKKRTNLEWDRDKIIAGWNCLEMHGGLELYEIDAFISWKKTSFPRAWGE